ncbi:lysine transporter LysE [Dietzia natronolimnaea]|uniref:Lysine transporter LysE n=1 Tax=Dietzia natronolimnaea TaxID=161920 RepID=A0A2A2WRH3_9ACTN|nr:LysE family translocator [Dietzia natronolimnaea]PAY23839.1 lysine transporter LysE [Dietzia natronolimnaea]
MTAAQVAALYGVWVIAVISPGPDLVVVLHRSLVGRRHGVATAVGVVTGIAIWLAAAFAGLAALVRVYPQIMTGLQVAGGLLLASLGVLGLRGWWRSRSRAGLAELDPADPVSPDSTPLSPTQAAPTPAAPTPASLGTRPPGTDFVRGLATNLANPKALVFFGAVLTPFLSGEVPPGQAVALVAGMITVALVWFCTLAVAASHRLVNERVGRVLPTVDVVVSTLFVAVGVAFVIEALT